MLNGSTMDKEKRGTDAIHYRWRDAFLKGAKKAVKEISDGQYHKIYCPNSYELMNLLGAKIHLVS